MMGFAVLPYAQEVTEQINRIVVLTSKFPKNLTRSIRISLESRVRMLCNRPNAIDCNSEYVEQSNVNLTNT